MIRALNKLGLLKPNIKIGVLLYVLFDKLFILICYKKIVKYIIFITKLFLDALRDTIKIVNYFKLRNFNSFTVVIKLFLIRFIYAIPLFRNLKKINLSTSAKDEVNLCSNYINLNDTIKAIDKKGYSENFKINDEVLIKN